MYPFGHQVPTNAASALRSLYGTQYRVGTGADTLYPASGGSEDWAKGKMHVKYSYLFELRPEEQIMPTARETWEAVKTIADQTLRYQEATHARSPPLSAHRQAAFRSASHVCEDKDSLCVSWAASGACDTWPLMKERCPSSCRLC